MIKYWQCLFQWLLPIELSLNRIWLRNPSSLNLIYGKLQLKNKQTVWWNRQHNAIVLNCPLQAVRLIYHETNDSCVQLFNSELPNNLIGLKNAIKVARLNIACDTMWYSCDLCDIDLICYWLHCALASGAVYCNRSCLRVCVFVAGRRAGGRAVSEPYYSQRARSVCVSLRVYFSFDLWQCVYCVTLLRIKSQPSKKIHKNYSSSIRRVINKIRRIPVPHNRKIPSRNSCIGVPVSASQSVYSKK